MNVNSEIFLTRCTINASANYRSLTARTLYLKRRRIHRAPLICSRPSAYAETDTGNVVDHKTSRSLTLEEAQKLTQLHVGNVFELDIVKNIETLAECLNTDLTNGINTTDASSMSWRSATYGNNTVPRPSPPSFFELVAEATNDFTVRVLMLAGCTSMGLEYWIAARDGTSPEWIEGASILAALAVVVLVTAGNNWQKEKQFQSLQEASSSGSKVRAIRNGKESRIDPSTLFVGDLILVEAGDILRADGVLVAGSNIRMDEAALTGEADDIDKDPQTNQAMYSGSKVLSGFGTMLVTSVGKNSQAGSIASMITGESIKNVYNTTTNVNVMVPTNSSNDPTSEKTNKAPPSTWNSSLRQETVLQKRLAVYAEFIGKVGLGAAVFAMLAMVSRFTYYTFLVDGNSWDWMYLHNYLNFFITAVTIVVVAVPEGLPLAVTISLAYSVLRMLEQNNLVRHLGAAETMGSATVICTDKTGTLTANKMAAMKFMIAGYTVDNILIDATWTDRLKSTVSEQVLDIFNENITMNSTASLYLDGNGIKEESGNRTEIALLQLAQSLGCRDAIAMRDRGRNGSGVTLIGQEPFSSESKRMLTAVRYQSRSPVGNGGAGASSGNVVLYLKGAAELVLDTCTYIMQPDGTQLPLSKEESNNILCTLQDSSGTLRVVALAYKIYSTDKNNNHTREMSMARGQLSDIDGLEEDMVLIAVIGIADPLRPEAAPAIAACQRAGIQVKMFTGDNTITATSIAKECGILPWRDQSTPLHPLQVLDGEQFRSRVIHNDGTLNTAAFLEIWQHIRVLSRCSPADKYTIITAARSLTKDIIGVTGDGTNDAPALRAAHVGFAMNCGTEVAKEAADIILLDNNFASTVSAILWGRNVYANVTRFLQFQLTINLVAVCTAVAGAVTMNESPLTAVQMLWVNLIMDSLASLALATESPEESLLDLPPYSQDHHFVDFSTPVPKHILGQAMYQLGVVSWLLWSAPDALGMPAHISGLGPSVHHTLVFNTFVVMQLFNQVNCRKIVDSGSIWQGLEKAELFKAVLGAEVMLQIAIVQWGGEVFSTVPLNAGQWALCYGFGLGTLLLREGLRRVL